LALSEGAGDRHTSARVAGDALANLGVAARGRRDLDLAEARYEAAQRVYRAHGLERGLTRTYLDLGDLARDRGDHTLAVDRYRACLARLGERTDLRSAAEALDGVASAAAAWDLADPAARLYGAAEAMRERAGATILFPVDQADHARRVESIRVRLGGQGLAAAWAEGRTLSWAQLAATVAGVTPQTAPKPPAWAAGQPFGLTRREVEVLRLLVEGRTDREIATALHVSPRTVEWHVGSILTKLGVESRREAVAVAIRDRLV
jgi:DNA-binding NarL/FixJ family response regulator